MCLRRTGERLDPLVHCIAMRPQPAEQRLHVLPLDT